MEKINRMAHAKGIMRNGAMAMVGHNKCVDKINEIVDVLNEREVPKEEERILWINENCKVVEFCCDALEGDFADYYDIVKDNHYVFEVDGAPYYIGQTRIHGERKMAQDSLYLVKCPYCGASIKCRSNIDLIVDAIMDIGIGYSEEDLRNAVEVLKRSLYT